MYKQFIFTVFLIISLKFKQSEATPLIKPLTFMPNWQYMHSGTYANIAGSVDVSLSITPTSPFTVTIPFLKAQNDTHYQAGLTISKFHFAFVPGIYIHYNLTQFSRTTSTITAKFQSRYMSQLSVLSIRYIIIPSIWNKFDSFYHYQTTNTSIYRIDANSHQSYSIDKAVDSNYTLGLNIFFFSLVCVDAKIQINTIISHTMELYKTSINTYYIKLYNNYFTQFWSYGFGIYVLSFNLLDLSLLQPQVQYHQLNSPIFLAIPQLYFSDTSYSFRNYNFILGVSSFQESFSLNSSINFKLILDSNISINLTTIDSYNSDFYFYFRFGYFLIKQCQDTCPYLLVQYNLCFQQCPLNFYSSENPQRCLKCIDVLPLCSKCTNDTICLKCFKGHLAIGGCSIVPGCTKINRAGTCLQCDNTTYYKSGDICLCLEGNLVTGHCTSIKQCTTTDVYKGNTVCIGCDTRIKYRLQNYFCLCYEGYYPIPGFPLLSCKQICGDGLVYQDQCDDQNAMSGDGCSSSCEIENKYKCLGGSTKTKSNCTYIGDDIRLTLISTSKNEDQNQGIFTFQFQPVIHYLTYLDFRNDLLVQCDQNMTFSGFSYIDGLLTILIDYTSDLQQKQGNITLSFEQSLIKQLPIHFIFKIRSDDVKLLVYKKMPYIKILKMVILIETCLILLLIILGAICHKTISMQLIRTYLIILICFQFKNQISIQSNIFQVLTVLTGNVWFFINRKQNLYFGTNYFAFNEFNFQTSWIIMSTLLIISCICFAILKTIKRKKMNQAKNKKIINNNAINIKIQKVYNSLIFPLSMGYFLFFTLMIQRRTESHLYSVQFLFSKFHPNYLLKFIVKLIISLIFFFEWKIVFLSKKQDFMSLQGHFSCKYWYIHTILTFSMLISLLTALNNGWFSNPLIIIIGLVCIQLLIVIINKPYFDLRHNLVQVFNLLTIILFGIWILMRNYFPVIIDEQIQIYFCVAFLILFALNILANSIRIFYQYKQILCKSIKTEEHIKVDNKQIEDDNIEKQNKKIKMKNNQLLQPLNSYCFVSLSLNQIFEKELNINRQRIINNTNPLKFNNSLANFDQLRILKSKKKDPKSNQQLNQLIEQMRQQFRQAKLGK